MDHIQKKEQQYAKWNSSVWNSVEKELSLFQKKVADCMISLADAAEKKSQDNYKINPILETQVILGEDFYLELIRPVCVKRDYLPKKLPSKEDFQQYEPDSDQQQIMQKNAEKKIGVVEQPSKKGKKGGKHNQNKGKQQKMKIQIAKDNFNKDIDLVINSHSFDRLQMDFGLKHQKIQVKLITFFYVAAYFRKNKVNQKIQQGAIFELINILIKIVRIFKGLKGPSFLNSEQQIEVSSTLILDLQMCIDGMKKYYKYDNRTVIIRYPKLVYYTNYDKFFPTLDIKPYKSQIQFMNSVKEAFNDKNRLTNPTLILYKPMIGSGKTTAAIALVQYIRELKIMEPKNINLQLVYSCVVGSVRIQVGRYAYNKQQKFALSSMQSSIKDPTWVYPRVINSWSCKNEKIVDLLISDSYCTYEMLDKHHYDPVKEDIIKHQKKQRKTPVHVGQLQRQNVILFIDEPTAFCKDENSAATRKIFDILANYPPKLTILSSATMPQQKQLQHTIQLIKRKNPNLVVKTVDSKQFHIGCQYCSFRGDVIFPHTGIKNKQQLLEIIDLLKRNPFLLRLYTGPSLFFLIRRCEKVGLKNDKQKMPRINELPQVRQQDILRATFRILNILAQQDNKTIQQICKMSADEANIQFVDNVNNDSDDDLYEKQDEQDQKQTKQKQSNRKDYVNFKKMLKQDAHKFLGGCLIATPNPVQFAHAMFEKWVCDIKPIKRLMDKYRRDQQNLQKQIRAIQEDDEMNEQNKSKKITKLMNDKEPTLDFPQNLKINTSQHYNKYCRNKISAHNSMLIKPIPVQSIGQEMIDEVPDFILKLLLCGVAVYMKSGISTKYLDKVEELATQSYLAYIITDQSLCYGTNFPISNVILRDQLAMKLNMNEMFQLIGRAGRVGQSWTARAFLQGHGLKLLQNYIHKKQFQQNIEGKIFEKIAKQHLDDPALKMRTLKAQIRTQNYDEKSDKIEVQIKKAKQQDYDIVRKVTVIPFVRKDNEIQICCKRKNYKTINYYEMATSSILYEDIPTIKNSIDEDIIDIKKFYEDQPKYIQQLVENSTQRIVRDILDNQIILKNQQLNKFAPKLYARYFCRQTHTMSILVQCQQAVKVNKQFQFLKLNNNSFKSDDIVLEKIKKLLFESEKLAKKIRDNPVGLTQIDIKPIKQLHEDLLKQQISNFYRPIYQAQHKFTNQQYKNILQKVVDQNAVQYKQLSQTILTIDRMKDLVNIYDKNYNVDNNVRNIWMFLQKVMYGQQKP